MVAHVGAARVRAWNPGIAGIREVFHARFANHAYPKHTHDVWTLFIVDDGAIRYDLESRAGGAETSTVSILPPHVAHDGRAADARGFAKRVLYLETSVIDAALTGAAVDDPILHAAGLRSRVAALHDVLICGDRALEAETRLAFIAESIRSALGAADDGGIERPTDELAEQLRAYLDSRLFEPIRIADAASDLGASPTQLARSFSATFRIAPHTYVLGRRLEAARARILDGVPLAEVAAEVGFYDQAHLSRHFTRFIATTPGRFVAAGRTDGHAPAAVIR
jgi:AraC-like DNA-binding protein